MTKWPDSVEKLVDSYFNGPNSYKINESGTKINESATLLLENDGGFIFCL